MRLSITLGLVLSVATALLAQPKAPLYNTAKQKILEGKRKRSALKKLRANLID